MKSSHRLVAILFTDISGFSAMMDKDERGTLALLDVNREIHNKYISKYGGSLIKEIGDGNFVSFESVSIALYCAEEIRREALKVPGLNLRTGVHLGEVIHMKGDIFGGGVNIASRIEGLAEPGQILISEQVYLNIANRTEFQTEFLGKKSLKNIAEPIGIYSVEVLEYFPYEELPIQKNTLRKYSWIGIVLLLFIIAVIILLFQNKESTITNPKTQTMAILPFKALNNSEQYAWLPEALSDEIRRNIAKIPDIRVIPGASTEVLENRNFDFNQIIEELNVDYLADGNLLFKDQSTQVNFELIDAKNLESPVIESFDFNNDSIYEAQKRIAERITLMIKPALPSDMRQWPDVRQEAFLYYLKGRHHYKLSQLELAETEFNNALLYEKNFSLAYAGLADVYLSWAHLGRRPHEVFPQSIQYAEKALSINPNEPYAMTALADCNYHYHYDWDFSEEHFQKALEINPNYNNAIWWYSGMLSAMNRHEEAIELLENLKKLDPFNMASLTWSMRMYYWAGEPEQARKAYEHLIRVWPDIPIPWMWLDYAKVYAGEPAQSVRILKEKVRNMNSFYPRIGLAIAHVYNGQDSMAREILADLLPMSDKIGPNYLAQVSILLGEHEQALELLEKGLEERDAALIWINADPIFDPVRQDERFQEVIRQMNLENYPPN